MLSQFKIVDRASACSVRLWRPAGVAAALAMTIAGCAASGDDGVAGAGSASPATPAESPGRLTAPTAPAVPPDTPPPVAGAKTVEAAVQRFESFLRALGREDVATLCEVAGPAAEQAEREGFGPCETTFPIMFRLLSDEQKRALRDATVVASRVEVKAPGLVQVPASAIKASVTFTDEDLGVSVLEHRNGVWYVVD